MTNWNAQRLGKVITRRPIKHRKGGKGQEVLKGNLRVSNKGCRVRRVFKRIEAYQTLKSFGPKTFVV